MLFTKESVKTKMPDDNSDESQYKPIDFGILNDPDKFYTDYDRTEKGKHRFGNLVKKLIKRKKGNFFTREELKEILLVHGLSNEQHVERHLEEVLTSSFYTSSLFNSFSARFITLKNNTGEIRYGLEESME